MPVTQEDFHAAVKQMCRYLDYMSDEAKDYETEFGLNDYREPHTVTDEHKNHIFYNVMQVYKYYEQQKMEW